jgi:hypothetical protein
MLSTVLFLACIALVFADHPTLPTQWVATTNEPGAGVGVEGYNFVSKPTSDMPSSLWSNYTDSNCYRLINVVGSQQTRYLLGCDSVACCKEQQSGNQYQFQIPNFAYSDPRKEVEIAYARVNVTNFGERVEADEWSWDFAPDGITIGQYKVYTNKCDDCVNNVELIQWSSSAVGSSWYPIQFKDFKGIDPESQEGKEFAESFEVPDVCLGNILTCSSEVSKAFGKRTDVMP